MSGKDPNRPRWHFTPLTPGFTVRNPVSASFFDDDPHLDSIVREAIQNSIDAHAGDRRVEVRIYFSGNSGVALKGSQYEPFYENNCQMQIRYAMNSFESPSVRGRGQGR